MTLSQTAGDTGLVAQVWLQTGAHRNQPKSIEILEKSKKSEIYRLIDAGKNHHSIIAKRGQLCSLITERIVYEKILPQIPLPSLQFLGFMEEPCGEYGWLFIEDAGNLRTSREAIEERMAISKWLGIFHSTSARIPMVDNIPHIGPDQYLQRIVLMRNIVVSKLNNVSPYTKDHGILAGFIQQCNYLEEHWSRIDNYCSKMPSTLTHGDLADENIAVRYESADMQILVLDWEKAGYGTITPDLAYMAYSDLDIYRDTSNKDWLHITNTELKQLYWYGKIFQIFTHNLARKSVKKLYRYSCRLQNAMLRAGLVNE